MLVSRCCHHGVRSSSPQEGVQPIADEIEEPEKYAGDREQECYLHFLQPLEHWIEPVALGEANAEDYRDVEEEESEHDQRSQATVWNVVACEKRIH